MGGPLFREGLKVGFGGKCFFFFFVGGGKIDVQLNAGICRGFSSGENEWILRVSEMQPFFFNTYGFSFEYVNKTPHGLWMNLMNFQGQKNIFQSLRVETLNAGMSLLLIKK